MIDTSKLLPAPPKAFDPNADWTNFGKYTILAMSRLLAPTASPGTSTGGVSTAALGSVLFCGGSQFELPSVFDRVNERITFLVYATIEVSCTPIDITEREDLFQRFIGSCSSYPVDFARSSSIFGLSPLCGASIAIMDEPADPKSEGQAALDAADDLVQFLRVTYELLGRIVDIGRTTFSAWRRGVEPRGSSVSKLFSLQSLTTALKHQMGENAARDWFLAGAHPRVQRLVQGEFDNIQAEGQQIILSAAPITPAVGFAPEPDLFLGNPNAGAAIRVTRKTPKRVALQSRDR